jgi:hypothetical protein
MSGLLGVVERFLLAADAFFDEMYGQGLDDAPQGGAQQAPALQQGGPQIVQQPVVPVVQPIVPQPQVAQIAPIQPVVAGPTLAQRLVTEQAAITAVRQTLSNVIWLLGDETVMTDHATWIDSYVNHQRTAPNLQNDQDADARLQELHTLVTTTAAVAGRVANRVKEVHALYVAHGALPGVPTAQAAIWTPLLGTDPPNENALLANLRTIEQQFAAALPVGFDALNDAAKAQRFTDMWKLRAAAPIPNNGVGDIYVSSFDGPKDRFGVSWNLTAPEGWVLHGHAALVWDADEQNVTGFQIPSLHIKPAAAEHATGVSVDIADPAVIGYLQRIALKHVQKLAKNRKYAEVFARTKFKKK